MEKLVFKEGFAFMYLLKEVYSKDSIISAAKDYSDFVDVSVTEVGKYNIVKLEKLTDDYEIEILAREFMNYVISEEFVLKK